MKPIRDAIAALGTDLGPDILGQCRALFDAEQVALALAVPVSQADIAYGPDARHRLDLYAPKGDAPAPILVFVHGGGFLKGDKGSADAWPWAAVAGALCTAKALPLGSTIPAIATSAITTR